MTASREELVPPVLTFPIDADTQLCTLVRALGFDSFIALARHVERIPYGRIPPESPVEAVLQRNRGTCSMKHALLATVARECGRSELELTVGIYLMSRENTPGIGSLLLEAGIESIPEAHCYLSHAGARYDFTGLRASSSSPFDALLEEHTVDPSILLREKPLLHRRAIVTWSALHGLSPDDAWTLRERCIASLAADTPIP